MIKRNPPSKGYKIIGSGGNAKAYEKDETVELIVAPDLYGKKLKYDLSRELMILARSEAPEKAKKHLPDIKRSRIDAVEINGRAYAEIVYSMPFYSEDLSSLNERYFDVIDENEGELPDDLFDALSIVFEIRKKYRAKLDLRLPNFSESKSGDLIIRDPLVCLQTGYDSIKLSDLWPADQFAIFSTLTRRAENWR